MSCTSPQCYLITGKGPPRKSLEDYPAGVYPGLGRVVYLPCGHCLSCRRERRQELTLLQCCEASLYHDNWFVTLTYDDDIAKDPFGCPIRRLCKWHIQEFVESMRKGLRYQGISSCRIFGCGEYGDTYGRPHYHFSLFGVPPAVLGISDDSDAVLARRAYLDLSELRTVRLSARDANGNHYWHSPFIAARWPYGNHMIYRACRETYQYIAGYVVKKLSGEKQKYIVPEFQFQSRPSIGYPWFLQYCNALSNIDGERLINDVLEIAGQAWKCPRIFDRWLERMDYFNGPMVVQRIKRLRQLSQEHLPDRDKLKRKADFEIYRDMAASVVNKQRKKGLKDE